jgi:hypothetical protein
MPWLRFLFFFCIKKLEEVENLLPLYALHNRYALFRSRKIDSLDADAVPEWIRHVANEMSWKKQNRFSLLNPFSSDRKIGKRAFSSSAVIERQRKKEMKQTKSEGKLWKFPAFACLRTNAVYLSFMHGTA